MLNLLILLTYFLRNHYLAEFHKCFILYQRAFAALQTTTTQSGLKQQFFVHYYSSVCWLVSARKLSRICYQMQADREYRAVLDWTSAWWPRTTDSCCWLLAEVINQELTRDFSTWFGFLREWRPGSERKYFKDQLSKGPRRKLTGLLWCSTGSLRMSLPLHSTGQANL